MGRRGGQRVWQSNAQQRSKNTFSLYTNHNPFHDLFLFRSSLRIAHTRVYISSFSSTPFAPLPSTASYLRHLFSIHFFTHSTLSSPFVPFLHRLPSRFISFSATLPRNGFHYPAHVSTSSPDRPKSATLRCETPRQEEGSHARDNHQ